ncbi:oligopeptide ABC transporter permease OppC [uncultured Murdochiella sp.]|uniref:oligopeptide ABC transporter permease OppC n=1 Tax=uncultured Murdochiella sp. TaxID=1586095 RepID=UPI0028052BEB|nr:oligopeptide ABC transporter permease OppC [uncultured Murdochiella sp.]
METKSTSVQETKATAVALDSIPELPPDAFEPHVVDETASEHIVAPAYSYWRSVFRKFFSSKVAIVMLVIMLAVFLLAFIQPMLSGFHNMDAPNINNRAAWYQRPSWQYPFGTNDIGQNLFDAVWAGARTSLFIAFVATAIVMVIGVIVGMFWGFSKKIDAVMIEVYNVISNIPFTLVVMVLAYTFGDGVWSLIFAMTCTTWISVAYFIRVQVMIIRDREYNLASQTLGSSTPKIIRNNILPYLVSVLMTLLSRYVPMFISTEVFLSFLGVGLTSAIPSLGRIVQKNALYMTSAPYLFLIPLAVTALISVSLYIVGQTLADASDPRNHMV